MGRTGLSPRGPTIVDGDRGGSSRRAHAIGVFFKGRRLYGPTEYCLMREGARPAKGPIINGWIDLHRCRPHLSRGSSSVMRCIFGCPWQRLRIRASGPGNDVGGPASPSCAQYGPWCGAVRIFFSWGRRMLHRKVARLFGQTLCAHQRNAMTCPARGPNLRGLTSLRSQASEQASAGAGAGGCAQLQDFP